MALYIVVRTAVGYNHDMIYCISYTVNVKILNYLCFLAIVRLAQKSTHA